MNTAAPRENSRQGGVSGLLVVAVLWVASVMLVRPFGAFPLFDDWVYAWGAKRLAQQGVLDLPEWSSVYPLFQIAYGALWVRLLGNGEWVLRLATVALALAGNLAWYAMLRRVGMSARAAACCVALVVFHPIYYLLALSFMTDVHLVALWQIALYCALRWSEKLEPGWLVAATLVVLASAFVRQTGAALLVGLLAVAWPIDDRRQRFVPLIAIAAVLLGVVVFGRDVGGGLPMTSRLADLMSTVTVSPQLYLDGLVAVVAFLGLSLAPAAVIAGRIDDRAAVAAAAVLLGAWIIDTTPVLRDGTMWGACELGGARSLLSGAPGGCMWQTPVRLVALAGAAIGLGGAWGWLGDLLSSGRLYRSIYDEGDDGEAEATWRFTHVVIVGFAAVAIGMTALWLFADRYWLAPAVLAPTLLLRGGILQPRAGAAAFALMALVAVVGTRGVFSFYREANSICDELVAAGRSASELDAGYCINAERRYLRLPPALSGEGRNAGIGWVTGIEAGRWTVANGVEPGWQLLRECGELVVTTRAPRR